jgi:transposase-like protein
LEKEDRAMGTLERFQRQARTENRGRSGRRRRYSRELRELAVRYRGERVGVGVERVAGELGISGESLRQWLRPGAGGFRRVGVVGTAPAGELVLITPGGCRIEGLKLEELSVLLGSVLG